MSFTALLLPLLPHLTHYQYLAEKKNLSTGFRPLPTLHPWLFCGNPTQTESPTTTPRARRAGAPAFRAPPRTPALRPAHWRPTILGSTHVPGSGLRALPPFFPSVLALRGCRAEPRAGGTHTHWAGPDPAGRSALRSAASSAQMRPACSPPPLRPGWEARPGAAPQGLPSHLRAARAAPARSAEARPRGAPSRAGAPGPPGRARRRRVACGRRPPPPSSRRSAPGPSRGAAPRRCRSGPTPGSGARSAPRPPRAAGQELGKEVRTLLLPPAGLPPGPGVGRRSRPLLGGRP